ncbi:MAG: DNA repair protein RecN [Hydrogenophilaceae bacterium]|nr:DNA repair protein RecN [Hydrogenophilaceae bacterium]
MLRHLSIRDFILVESLEIEFQSGLTVLTGETGAGKSILLDALSMVLGDRAESGIIRQGARKAEISAEFDVTRLPQTRLWLEENGLDSNAEFCILRRLVEIEGRSRAFINGSSVTLAQLRELGEQLVDIHGQHAHHALLKQSVQRELLDEYSGGRVEASETLHAWQAWQSANRHLLAANEQAGARLLEREGLESARAEAEHFLEDMRHWEEFQAEHQRQTHMSGLIESSAKMLVALEDEETGVLRQLGLLRNLLQDMLEKDASLSNEMTLLDSAISNLDELMHQFGRYADRLNLDPERLADLDRRMTEVMRISRKHRLAPADMPERYASWQARLAELDAQQDLEFLEQEQKRAKSAYEENARRLTAKREKAALSLSRAVTETMAELALGDGKFAVRLTPCSPQSHGMEDVDFLVTSHASLPLGPLDKIASGGELSRISLSIQAALSGVAGVPTMIFDEVDVGIGGGVAEAVGRRLAQLASSRQVMVITHLPQVAAWGSNHLRVSKLTGQDRVISQVEQLDREDRVFEIARMLGGREITETTLKHAREMLASTGTGKSGRSRTRSG